ncbi:General stress protein 69 [bacterium HR19]|nr:General stress protein 69 [bacterium HR19]
MEYRRFKGLDKDISVIGFGVWTVASDWWGVADEEKRRKLLIKAVDSGINFFDTADVYGDGYGEEILKKVFGPNLKNFVIATKVGYNFYDYKRDGHREHPQDFSEKYVRRALENSLKRLGLDCIDLYQIHNPKKNHITDELVELLERLKEEGKIRAYGGALGPDIGWVEEGKMLMEKGVLNIQIIYSILEQEPANTFFEIGKKFDARFIVRVPHASGLLDGTADANTVFDSRDHRSFRKSDWMKRAYSVVQKLKLTQKISGMTLGQIAIAFCLTEPSVTTVLPNFTDESQISEWVQVAGKKIGNREILEEIKKAYYEDLHPYITMRSS